VAVRGRSGNYNVFLKLPFEVRKEPEGSSGKGGWWVREEVEQERDEIEERSMPFTGSFSAWKALTLTMIGGWHSGTKI